MQYQWEVVLLDAGDVAKKNAQNQNHMRLVDCLVIGVPCLHGIETSYETLWSTATDRTM